VQEANWLPVDLREKQRSVDENKRTIVEFRGQGTLNGSRDGFSHVFAMFMVSCWFHDGFMMVF
jgi:hypothetical protein